MHGDWRKRQPVMFLFMLGAFILSSACTSPEARRTRGGGPGADSGNRDAVVKLHENTQPYYQTPCLKPTRQC